MQILLASECIYDWLQKKALMFISRGFSSSQGNHRELYCALIAFLYEYFTAKKHPVMKVKNGIDVTKQECSNVLLAVCISKM